MSTLASVASLYTFAAMASAQSYNACLRKTFPVVSGGDAEEVVNCMVHDPVNEKILVGGYTRSDDYGPASTRHGFLYAVDFEGDWAWGRYYYNTTSISSITGCSLSSDGTQVVVAATGYQQPVFMVIDTTDGEVDEFYSL